MELKPFFFCVAIAIVMLVLLAIIFADSSRYMVVDLTSGGISYMRSEPSGGWSDEYKTSKLVLRKIKPGIFVMGTPKNEVGSQYNDEKQHVVVIEETFYIGIFEVTQKQYELIMGNNPSQTFAIGATDNGRGNTRPVCNVPFLRVRGSEKGICSSQNGEVDSDSFLGKLRAKTKLKFDLPTEAQWEYACRAGTTTALYSGNNLAEDSEDPNLNKLGRNMGNGGLLAFYVTVGSFRPNFWGLYDMYGNVSEWCLDKVPGYGTERYRALRGGCYKSYAASCRSASRGEGSPNYPSDSVGFRLVLVQ